MRDTLGIFRRGTVALVVWLKREGFGSYATIDDFVGELARRSTSALGGFGAILASKQAEDVKEAAQGNGQVVCVELVRDLRMPKGARAAALRALLLAGMGAHLPRVFAGSSDLFADVRVPEADRPYLCKTGLTKFLEAQKPDAVTLELARGAASAAEAVKVVGIDAVREVVQAFPVSHVAALTCRHAALGEALDPDLARRWLELLTKQFKAAKAAPAAAKRLGTAPEWPPVVPDVFRPLVEQIEKGTAPVPAAPAPAAPVATPAAPTPTATPAAAAPKMVAPLRPARGRAPEPEPEPERYVGDAKAVAPEALRSPAPAPVKRTPLAALRFGPQVTLVAQRGTRAVERLLAAYDVRRAKVGNEKAIEELQQACDAHGARDVNQPILDEVLALALDRTQSPAWRRAAKTILEVFSPDRAATVPEVVDVRALNPRPGA